MKASGAGNQCTDGWEYFVGTGLHKEFMQVAVMGRDGEVVWNRRTGPGPETVRREFSAMPENARHVLESSSVWYGACRLLRDEMGLDVVLSNPLATRPVAQSKKTDKAGAAVLADLLRGGYVATCHVPDGETARERQLVRYRARMVRERTRFRNLARGILLQRWARIPGTPFSRACARELRGLGDRGTGKRPRTTGFPGGDIADCDARIRDAAGGNGNARLPTTIPGVGNVTAPGLAPGTGDVSRFGDTGRMASYFGLVPSVRNSAGTVHHGRMTKAGAPLVRHLPAEAVIARVTVAARKGPPTPISAFCHRIAGKRGDPRQGWRPPPRCRGSRSGC